MSIANDGSAMFGAVPVIAGDGRYVVFNGSIPDVGGSNGIYVRDRENGTTDKMPVAPEVAEAGSPAYPQISDDGQVVAFLAVKWKFPDWMGEIFRYDRSSGMTTHVGTLEHNYEEVSLSGDGRYVAYMPPEDAEGNRPCLLYDAATGQTSRIDVANSTTPPTDQCFRPRLAADANVISFTHYSSTGLVPCEHLRPERTAVLYLADTAESPQCGAGSACGAFVCDDGDACTLDSCVEGRCGSEPAPWTAATATCVLPDGWMPASCEIVGLPRTLLRHIARMAERLARIPRAAEGRQRPLARHVVRRLERVQKSVRRLGARGRLDEPCTAELQAALGVAQERIAELRALL